MRGSAIRTSRRERIDLWINYLIVALGFTLPISTAANNILLAFILLLWLAAGGFKERWERIKNNQAAVAIIIFFLLHIAGLIYSSDPKTGILEVLIREQLLLFMPIILSVIKKEFIKIALNAFLISMTIAVALSYALYFDLTQLPWRITRHDKPIPFSSSISYAPILAFATILMIHRFLDSNRSLLPKITYLFLIMAMSYNIFISGGRAGQIGFVFALLFYLAYQLRKEIKKMLLVIALVISGILLVFFFNKPFHDRIMLAYYNVVDFKVNPSTSVGVRINFAINSWELIKKRPILGYGTGSFKEEYARINQALTPNVHATSQPHNFYILTLVQFGATGLAILLYLFYSLFKIARNIDDNYRGVRYAFLILFMSIMFSDSYLLGHYTTLFFVFVTALLFGGRVERS